jgi:hypothetical protein
MKLRCFELDLIESYLMEKGFDIEDYTNPEKGISQLEAIMDTLDEITENAWKYQYLSRRYK